MEAIESTGWDVFARIRSELMGYSVPPSAYSILFYKAETDVEADEYWVIKEVEGPAGFPIYQTVFASTEKEEAQAMLDQYREDENILAYADSYGY